LLNKILISLDGGSCGDSLAAGMALAKVTESQVAVVRVNPPREQEDALPGSLSESDHEAEMAISKARSYFSREGIKIRGEIVNQREPADAILELAGEGWYELVVVPSGEGAQGSEGNGTLAAEVVARFPGSVLVVKENGGLSDLAVLVDDPDDTDLIDLAVGMASATDSGLKVLTSEGYGADVVLRSSLQKVADMGLSPMGEIVQGSGVPDVVDAAEGNGTNLLILRKPRPGPLGRVLGRNGRSLGPLLGCRCSVLLVA
jgi:hypothetical protein